MNLVACRLLAMGSLFVSSISGSADTVADFDLVFKNPQAYEDKWVTIRGFVRVDGQGHHYLFKTSGEAKKGVYQNSIDLIAVIPGLEKATSPLVDMACADVYGQFNSYGEQGVLQMGALASNAGLLTVKRVSECPN